jgi:hypothetical protein
MPNCPEIPENLMRYLQEIIPERNPSTQQSIEDLYLYAGKREVVLMLQKEFDIQRDGNTTYNYLTN